MEWQPYAASLTLESLQAARGGLGRAAAAREGECRLVLCTISLLHYPEDLGRDRKHLGRMCQITAGLKCQPGGPTPGLFLLLLRQQNRWGHEPSSLKFSLKIWRPRGGCKREDLSLNS